MEPLLRLSSVTLFIAVTGILSLLSILFVYFLNNNQFSNYYDAFAQRYIAAPRGTNSSVTNSSSPTLSANNNSSNILSSLGMATATAKPDKVTVIVGVETTNKTAKAALSSKTAAMNKVLEALLSAGVKKNETSTSTFS